MATEMITGPEGTSVTARRACGRRAAGVKSVRVTRAEIVTPVTFTADQAMSTATSSATCGSPASPKTPSQLVAKALRQGGARRRRRGSCSTCAATAAACCRKPSDRQPLLAEGRGRRLDQHRAAEGTRSTRRSAATCAKRPVVVLIDRDTASSAEILTAALADDAGATVVGTRSYGKGVFQQEIGLSNGGALKLTVGATSRPTASTWRGKGIHPDVYVRDNPRTKRDEAMQRALEVLAHQVHG